MHDLEEEREEAQPIARLVRIYGPVDDPDRITRASRSKVQDLPPDVELSELKSQATRCGPGHYVAYSLDQRNNRIKGSATYLEILPNEARRATNPAPASEAMDTRRAAQDVPSLGESFAAQLLRSQRESVGDAGDLARRIMEEASHRDESADQRYNSMLDRVERSHSAQMDALTRMAELLADSRAEAAAAAARLEADREHQRQLADLEHRLTEDGGLDVGAIIEGISAVLRPGSPKPSGAIAEPDPFDA